jgi:hypothetical protein
MRLFLLLNCWLKLILYLKTLALIELVVDETEIIKLIINGNLNKRFCVNYFLLEYDKINELLSELENDKKETRITTCFVKDSEDEIPLGCVP